jgi:uncharacterized protein (TIGR02757 family)
MTRSALAATLDALYDRCTRRECVGDDPVRFLYDYADPADREVVALIASSLAYGRVKSIRASVADALARLGDRPARTVFDEPPRRLAGRLGGFRHRFCSGEHLAALLAGARRVMRTAGSLGEAMSEAIAPDHETLLPALGSLVERLDPERRCGHLLAVPRRRSACKRLHLMLRWLVRRDAVDPGGWDGSWRRLLVVPLDTHMHRIARALEWTERRSADARTAIEVTRSLARACPDDPVRYDFALTRLGICPRAERAGGLDRLISGRLPEVCMRSS